MSDSEVIKEFLVAVGVKVDEHTLTRFGGILGDIGGRVALFATVLVGAGAAVTTFVTKVSEKMEDLYWSSQRLGSSVSAIQDYALGIQNLGGTAEGARSSLEGVMRLLRTNPGYGGLLASLGVNPRLGGVGIMQQLGSRFQHMPYFIAAQYAASLGIDEQTLWAMTHAPRGGVQGPYNSLYKSLGMDPDKAAKSAHDFMVQIRDLEAEFTVIAESMSNDLLPVARKFTKWTADFLKSTVIPWLKNLTPEKVEGWIHQFDSILAKLGAIADGLYKILQFLGVIPHTGPPPPKTHWQLEQERIIRQQKGTPAQQAEWNNFWRGASNIFSKIGNAISSWTSNAIQQSRLVDYFIKQGWSRDDAAAIVGNLQYESGLDPRQRQRGGGPGYGLAQWEGPRQALFKKVTGVDIHSASADQQAAFVQWEFTHTEQRAAALIRAAKSVTEKALVMSRFYERPANVGASASARAAIANRLAHVTISQKTDIHVNGTVGGAAGVARDVVAQQGRVNGDLLRNTKMVIQ